MKKLLSSIFISSERKQGSRKTAYSFFEGDKDIQHVVSHHRNKNLKPTCGCTQSNISKKPLDAEKPQFFGDSGQVMGSLHIIGTAHSANL